MKHNSIRTQEGPVLSTKNILLTGATGILGAHLMKRLLQEEDETKLYCIIRADSPEHAAQRLISFLAAYDPERKLETRFFERVVPLPGDVSEENFGLPVDKYHELTEVIDATLHVAAITNLFLNWRRIAPTNVGGTRGIIDFCLKTRQKYLCYISTHTVTGDKTFDKSVRFKESDLDIGQGFAHMTYQHTKFTAEKMVREASKNGLIWNIMRPGQIFGEAATGSYPLRQSNVSGLFYDILKTIIESGVAMTSGTQFDVVPVDYVSQGILTLGLKHPARFETYHLTNPDVKTYSEFVEVVRSLGYRIKVIPQEEYRRMLLAGEVQVNGKEYKSGTTSAFKWWFKRGISFYDSAVTDCSYTQRLLEQYQIHCPRIDRTLLATYAEAAARQDYFPPPPKAPAARPRHEASERRAYEVSAL